MTTTPTLPAHEAIRRIELDRDVLTGKLARHSDDALVRPFLITGGPLGDSCESLRDLVAHVLMWDEMNLAVLTEARAGRRHWSLDTRWETPDAGPALNTSGVAAGRELPVDLLLHRFRNARQALPTELRSYTDDQWNAPIRIDIATGDSMGDLAQYVMTISGTAPYWHAAVHLHRLTLPPT